MRDGEGEMERYFKMVRVIISINDMKCRTSYDKKYKRL